MSKKKGLMKVTELTERITEIMNSVVWNVYGRPVSGKPGITFDFTDFEQEKIRRKKFREKVRELIEEELKRHYDIIP
jgi:hypothetical protein